MAFIQESDKAEIKAQIGELTGEVRILVFTQSENCQYCGEVQTILEEFAEIIDKVKLEEYDIELNADLAKKYDVKRAPAIVVMGEKDHGIRYYGLPAGYEFVALLNAVRMVGSSNHELAPETVEQLSKLTKPVHIQVFVTPSCPYCPNAVTLSHQFAMASDLVTADAVEATEFPELALQYNVRGVPRIVVNEEHHFEGAMPEQYFVEEVLKAVN
ncbi:MAG TPA: thioredoxin family protein [Candidatus Kryptobacter bacterium]|nr:thioredoxin family protein [Candidatus Kryptobacter bacterium]